MLESIEADAGCEPFLMPVAWEQLKLFDYPQIVARPMDFNTLKKNLNDGKFATYEEFLSDLQLIWDNCKLYNMQGSEIYRLAERMEKMTRRELQKFKSQYGLNGLTLPNSAPQRTAVPARSSKRSNNQRTTAEKDSIVDAQKLIKGGEPGQDPNAQIDEVTKDMKLEFCAKVKKLSNKGLTSLVNKVKELKAATIQDLPEDKI